MEMDKREIGFIVISLLIGAMLGIVGALLGYHAPVYNACLEDLDEASEAYAVLDGIYNECCDELEDAKLIAQTVTDANEDLVKAYRELMTENLVLNGQLEDELQAYETSLRESTEIITGLEEDYDMLNASYVGLETLHGKLLEDYTKLAEQQLAISLEITSVEFVGPRAFALEVDGSGWLTFIILKIGDKSFEAPNCAPNLPFYFEGTQILGITLPFSMQDFEGEELRVYLYGGLASAFESVANPWQPEPGLCTPILLYPEESDIMDNGRTDWKDDIIWDFDWTDCENATKYQLYVVGPGASYPTYSIEVTDSEFHDVSAGYIPSSKRLGWAWRIRAMVSGEWGPWSKIGYFDVEPADTDAPK